MIANMRETLSFDAGVYLDVYAATDCVRSLIFVISIMFIASVSPRLSTLAAAVHPWGFAFPLAILSAYFLRAQSWETP